MECVLLVGFSIVGFVWLIKDLIIVLVVDKCLKKVMRV